MPLTPIHLIGIDVDGTLVGTEGAIHPSVWLAANRARAAGIRLMLCSGRPAFGLALEYAQRLDPGGWHVFQNGASIVHLATGESRSTALPSATVEALIRRSRESGDTLELYSDREYAVEDTSPWARAHADLLGVPFKAQRLETLRGPIVRAQWLFSAAQATQFMSRSHSGLEAAESSSPLMPDARFVGLTREGVTKGNALRTVAAEYSIALADVMYVGDSGNDRSALQIVGCPVAMGNADEDIRRIAARTVSSVDAGGLAEALDFATNARS